jgi:hypothetical protein
MAYKLLIVCTPFLGHPVDIMPLFRYIKMLLHNGLQIYEGRDDQLNRPGPMA